MYTQQQQKQRIETTPGMTADSGGSMLHTLAPSDSEDAPRASVEMWRKGHKLLLQARYDEAAIVFSNGLALDACNTAIMLSYAQTLIDGFRDFDGAETLYHRALAVNPTDSSALRLLGNFTRMARQDVEGADKVFKEALNVDPYCVDTLRDYADMKAANHDENGALVLHQRILKEEPSDPLAQSEVLRLRPIVIAKQRLQLQHAQHTQHAEYATTHNASHENTTPNALNGRSDQDLQGPAHSDSTGARDSSINEGGGLDHVLIAEGESGQSKGLEGAGRQESGYRAREVEEEHKSVSDEVFAMDLDAVITTGLAPLLHEWGDVKENSMKLTVASAPIWMGKCLLRLEETLTLAESFHEAGDSVTESLFRTAFANLLKLFYDTETRLKASDCESENARDQRHDTEFVHPAPLQLQKLNMAGGELRAWLSSKAEVIEATLDKEVGKGRSIQQTVGLHFPSRVTKVCSSMCASWCMYICVCVRACTCACVCV